MTLSSQNNKPKQIILNAFDMNSVLMSSAIGPIWRKL